MKSNLTAKEKERIVQDIINSYIGIQNDLMVQEDNRANDFCWNVFESLNALNVKERKFIISYFFKGKRLKSERLHPEMSINQKKAIEHFLSKIELK